MRFRQAAHSSRRDLRAVDGGRTRYPDVGNVVLCLLSYNRVHCEPPIGFEPMPFALPRRRSDRWSYRGMKLGKRDSDAHLPVSRTGGLPVTPFPMEPAAGLEPATSRLQGGRSAVDELGRRRVQDGI